MNANQLNAFLYLMDGERPSEELTDDEYNAWQMGSDPLVSELQSQNNIRFINSTKMLLNQLSNLSISREQNFIYYEMICDRCGIDKEDPLTKQYMTLFYNAAKRTYPDQPKMIREYFRRLYLVAFGKEDGPRWGEFVEIYGVQNFIVLIQNRMKNLI